MSRRYGCIALKKVANIDRRYENGDIEEKRLIVSSIFPDYLEFDGVQHRTRRLNSAIALIYQNNNKLQGKNKGTSLPFLDLSLEVESPRIELGSKQAIRKLSTRLVSSLFFDCKPGKKQPLTAYPLKFQHTVETKVHLDLFYGSPEQNAINQGL